MKLNLTFDLYILHPATITTPLQHLFGTDIGDVSNMTPSQIYEHSMRGIAQLQVKLTDLPLGVTGSGDDARVGRPNMLMLSHSHFVNYGGT